MKSSNFTFTKKFLQNYAINGNLDFWQRGTSITRTQAANQNGYLADRMFAVAGGATAKSMTIDQSSDLPTLPFPAKFSLQISNNTILSHAAGDYLEPIATYLESQMVKNLASGTITVGFWMWSAFSGTLPIACRNNGTSLSYVQTFAVNAGWDFYTVQIPLTGITILNTNALGFIITIGATTGTTFQSPTLNAWVAGNYTSHASVTNWASTTGAKLRFAQMQIREGIIEKEELKNTFNLAGDNLANELLLCQRYYEKNHDVDAVPTFGSTYAIRVGAHVSSDTILWGSTLVYKAVKRTAPIINLYGITTGPGIIHTQEGAAGGTDVAGTVLMNAPYGFTVRKTAGVTSGTEAGIIYNFTADAEF